MDILIWYWDSNDSGKVRYWTPFLEHSTNSNVLKHFNDSLSELDLSKMLQLSVDGPALNWKFFYALINYLSECALLLELINIFGSCSLHTVFGPLKTAVQSISWKIKKKLKSIWQIHHKSPGRREDFESVTGTNKYPLFFCSTRWVKRKCSFHITYAFQSEFTL